MKQDLSATLRGARSTTKVSFVDRASTEPYLLSESVELAVKVAWATGRPLLVRGPSGVGKSSLARAIAQRLDWTFHGRVMTARTQAQDLLWEVDQLKRLQDAQAKCLEHDLRRYVKPGVLWWAINPGSAAKQAGHFAGHEPPMERGEASASPSGRAVVLLDEIDKADPDVSNDLLVPLGSLQFLVEPLDETVKSEDDAGPLVFITTNDGRDLPVPFLRRCVEVVLTQPQGAELAAIGGAHFPGATKELLSAVAVALQKWPSTAEYLDAVRACLELGIEPGDDTWTRVVDMIAHEDRRTQGTRQ